MLQLVQIVAWIRSVIQYYHIISPSLTCICLCNATRLCKLVMTVNNSAPCSGAHVLVQSFTSALCNWMNLVFFGRKRTLEAGITDTLSHIHVNADGHFSDNHHPPYLPSADATWLNSINNGRCEGSTHVLEVWLGETLGQSLLNQRIVRNMTVRNRAVYL